MPIIPKKQRRNEAFGYSRSNIQFFRKLPSVLIIILLNLSLAWAMEKPTKSQLQSYAIDGSLNSRVQNALAIGNHVVAPDLVRDFYTQVERIRLIQAGRTDADIARDFGAAPIPRNVLRSKGTVKVFALLISFPDYPASQSAETIASKLFGEGDAGWPYESLRNYYRRSSYNTLDIEGNVLGWYTAPYARAGMPQTPEARENLVKEALQFYQIQGHDFSQYDNNGDGSIDYFMVIWTGPDNGWGGFWWGYQTSLSDQFFSLNGKKLIQTRYSWLRDSNPGEPSFSPKAAIHETGHALGLPDYYDYADKTGPRSGIGSLDMMDGERGDHNPFSKMLLGWISPQVFDLGTREFTLRASGNSQDALLVVPESSANPVDEFFLVQNRFRAENDFYLPGDGLLIWHVDARVAGDGYFQSNNSLTTHRLLSLIEGNEKGHIRKGYPANSTDYSVEGKSIKLNRDSSLSTSTSGPSIYGIGPSGQVQSFTVDALDYSSPLQSSMIQASGSGNISSEASAEIKAMSSGVTYYVDATVGNDSNKGLSTATAWKTINKVNNSTFLPGDSILFKRGESWREQLIVPSSGLPGSPITFGAYGTGAKPIIQGADLVLEWGPVAGYTNVWKAAFATEPSQVYFNLIRGTKVTSAFLCDAPNKWYWASDVLYCYSASDPDSAFTAPGIEASIRTRTILVNAKDYIAVKDIACLKSKTSKQGSVYSNNSIATILDGLTLTDNDGFAGIFIEGSGNGKIVQNCTISYTRHDEADRGCGIILDGAGGSHTVSGNTLHDNEAAGIKLNMWTATSNNTISNNIVHSNGAAGITINVDSASNTVSGNTVYSNGTLIADTYSIDLFQVGNGNVVTGNIVHDHNYISLDAGGIRFDAEPEGIFGTGNKIYYNLIYNERTGVHLLGCDSAVVYNNSIYNSTVTGILVHGSDANANIVKNNIVHTSGANHIYNQDATNSVIDYNLYYPDTGTKFNWNGTGYGFANWKMSSAQDVHSPTPADPLFVSTVTLDFRLTSASPCINAGVGVGLTTDYAGNTVPQGATPDIGAYESGPPTTTIPPNVTTIVPLVIQSMGATVGGNVSSDGGAAVMERGVCWALTANPTISGSHTQAGSGTGSYTSSLTGLIPGKTYHVRAYATNSSGTGYGNDVTFTTSQEITPPSDRKSTRLTSSH